MLYDLYVCCFSSCFDRGCQNGSVYVWTLPQGGTVVSLPNILNSSVCQDRNTEVKVSLDLLLQLFVAALVYSCFNKIYLFKSSVSSSFHSRKVQSVHLYFTATLRQ